jgi:hypothetical protein
MSLNYDKLEIDRSFRTLDLTLLLPTTWLLCYALSLFSNFGRITYMRLVTFWSSHKFELPKNMKLTVFVIFWFASSCYTVLMEIYSNYIDKTH